MEGKEIIKNMTIGSFSVVKAYRYFQVVSDRGVLVADCDYLDKKYPCPTPIAIRFNAELICEAFNIANQTGMTPTTLHAELEKAKEFISLVAKGFDDSRKHIIIKKATTFLEAK